MTKSYSALALIPLLILTLISCKEEGDNNTIVGQTINAPATYRFERNGESSVSYSGQSERLAMGKELNAALLDFGKSAKSLKEMYANADANGNDVNPFTDPNLNASSKSLRSKTAASYTLFNSNTTESVAIRGEFDAWIEAQVNIIFPAESSTAEAGQPGQIADGTAARYVNGQGLEYNQAFAKSLIGALVVDQMLNNYLEIAVLEGETALADNDAGLLVEDQNYTNMEHKWDEAYGYLFGGALDGAAPLASLGGDDDFLNKYLGRVNDDPDFAGIAVEIYNALKLGRAAIVAKNYVLRDQQVAIIKEQISKVVAIRAVYYLQTAKLALLGGEKGTAFHDLSEAYGFIYSLRFTQNHATGSPYFSPMEVRDYLNDMLGDGVNGFWDLQISTLDAVSNSIATRFDFTPAQTIN